ncbi:DDX25 helicase, partial [Alca torda]|nr:DDX25 helicase [Alca torda]
LAETSLLNKLIRTSLVESSHHVEILQQDPRSPLFSIKTFEELPLKKELLQGIYLMGFNRPSKIQETALPIMLAYPPQNLIAQSQSGTGKTAAFVLAMLSRVNAAEKHPQCLCLAPTYELALQIGHVIENIGQFCADIKVTYAVRGNQVPQGSALEEQIVIGTPGTMLDWCFKRRAINVKKINMFVLDEADIMINTQGLSCQSIRIQRWVGAPPETLEIKERSPPGGWGTRRQQPLKVVFSQHLSYRLAPPLLRVLTGASCSSASVLPYFEGLKSAGSSLVKSRRLRRGENIGGRGENIGGSGAKPQPCLSPRRQTRRIADWLSVEMSQDGHQVAILTAELTVAQRANVIQRFRDGKEKVLIATNVCARGIDVQQVTIVVNFNLPTDQKCRPDFETYLHRIGRTGRFGKRGIAFSMVESQNVRLVQIIEEHFQTKIKQLDPDDMDELEKL